MAGVTSEVCENCGRQIGKLETPMAWREHVACQECYTRLSLNPPDEPKPSGRACEFCDNTIPPGAAVHFIKGMRECEECHRRRLREEEHTAPRGGQVVRPRFSKPPLAMKAMCWIGILLWFGPALLCIATGHPDLIGGLTQLMWLGCLLCIGSVVAWAIICSAKS